MSQTKTKFIEDLAVTTAKINTDAVTTAKILDANVTNAKVSTGIDAAKIADGSVSNAEFQFINSLTSNAQTQLNGKASTTLNNLTSPTAINQDLLLTGTKTLRTPNDVFTVGRNAGDTADIPIIKINAFDVIELGGSISDMTGVESISSENRYLADALATQTLNWGGCALNDLAGAFSLDWNARILRTPVSTCFDWNSDTILSILPATGAAARSLNFFNGAGTFSANIKAPALAASYTLTLPTDDGTASQVLTTDGSGVLSWTTPAADTGITQLTGDVTAGPGSGSQVATIAALAVTNAKIANSTIDLTTKVTSTLPEANGGTNQSTYATGDTLYASAANTLSKRTIGTSGQVLTVSAGIPVWATPAAGESRAKETITLSAGQITAQQVVLTNTPLSNSVHSIIDGAGGVLEGASYDYTISGANWVFGTRTGTGGSSELVAGDLLQISYEY